MLSQNSNEGKDGIMFNVEGKGNDNDKLDCKFIENYKSQIDKLQNNKN